MKSTLTKTTSPGRFVAQGLCAAAIALAPLAAMAQYLYNQPGDKNYMSNTAVLERTLGPANVNNQSIKITATRAQGDAAFATAPITVDGVREAAWDIATAYPIANKFTSNVSAAAPSATTEGTVRMLWDGPMLYVLVEVTGDATKSDTGTPNWSGANTALTTDGLYVFMDVFNDQWGMETDTQGVFFLGANPAAPVTSYTGSPTLGIPSLGSFFNANNQDYSTRLKAYKSSGYVAGSGVNYTYEFALQIEGWGDDWDRVLANGTKIGLELGIFNQGTSFAFWSKTNEHAAKEANSNMPNSERVRNRDWGVVTLSGWDEVTPFAYSGWRADEDIRFWNSKSNPGGAGGNGDVSVVWTPASKALMVGAKNDYLALKASGTATRAQLETAVEQVCQAFTLLTWADTKFPDPRDLPELQTLPNVWKFFDPTKGTNGMVTTAAEWAQRKEELRELAQFYEYGYKPKLGVDYTISLTTNAYSSGNTATVIAAVTPLATSTHFSGGSPVSLTVTVTLPTGGLPGVPQKAPIGFSTGFQATNGIANVAMPGGTWAAESRTDTAAWGNPNRSGQFYALFPYVRNSTSADVSYSMAIATGVSINLDILQMACAANPALDARIDPTRAATKGFSIGGKHAFVAGVFDERVKVIIAGGAGATGPANWRYNAQGQEYNFAGTDFVGSTTPAVVAAASAIVAHGTEGPGNSYRHNRIRETELFRHFMNYGHMYSHQEGAYGYGNYSRLPFDQALLVATLAPDRAIVINTNLNDYNDGSTTDNMSLSLAKFVYRGLGADGSKFIKFNNGNYVAGTADPHGSAGAGPEGRYLSEYFYGAQTSTPLTAAEAIRLNTDPYSLLVCNGQTQSPYDYYWGGFNTITGGTGGVNGTGGWHTYDLNDNAPVITAGQSFVLGAGPVNTVGTPAATDADTQPTTFQNWQITGGSGAGVFAINPLTGKITISNPTGINFALTSYTLTVRVGDGMNTSAPQTITITIPTTIRITVNGRVVQSHKLSVPALLRAGGAIGG